MAYIPQTGSVVSFQGGAWNASVSGTVGASIIGLVPTNPSDNLGRQMGTLPFVTRADTYTGAANGTTVTLTTYPVRDMAIVVKGTGAPATTWDIRLESSLDGTNFTQVLQHTNTTGDGIVLYSGSNDYPSLYIRSRCAAVVLGGASNVVVTILGIQ